jgi:hypothetical protein
MLIIQMDMNTKSEKTFFFDVIMTFYEINTKMYRRSIFRGDYANVRTTLFIQLHTFFRVVRLFGRMQ